MTIFKMQLTLRTFVDSFRAWLQEDVDNTTLTGDSGWKRRHCTCVQEFDRYIATLGPDDQRLFALATINEGANFARGGGNGPPQQFNPSRLQTQIIGRVGTTTDQMPDAGTLLEEFVAAAAVDFKEMVTEAQQGVRERDTRIKELEQEAADERTRHETTQAILAGRDSDNASLRAEIKELNKQIETLQRFLGDGDEIGSSGPGEQKRKVLGKPKDREALEGLPGVYRRTSGAGTRYEALNPNKGGPGKKGFENFGADKEAAIARRAEIEAEIECEKETVVA